MSAASPRKLVAIVAADIAGYSALTGINEACVWRDGANIAARLEGYAESGRIYVSRQVFEQVEG